MQTNNQTNSQTNKPTNKQTNKQTNEQTNKQANEETNKQTNKQSNKQTNLQHTQVDRPRSLEDVDSLNPKLDRWLASIAITDLAEEEQEIHDWLLLRKRCRGITFRWFVRYKPLDEDSGLQQTNKHNKLTIKIQKKETNQTNKHKRQATQTKPKQPQPHGPTTFEDGHAWGKSGQPRSKHYASAAALARCIWIWAGPDWSRRLSY
jgi:hypothetical protein